MKLNVMPKILIRTFDLPTLFTTTFVDKRKIRDTNEFQGLRHWQLTYFF